MYSKLEEELGSKELMDKLEKKFDEHLRGMNQSLKKNPLDVLRQIKFFFHEEVHQKLKTTRQI